MVEQSINLVQVIGTLKEINMKVEDAEVELRNSDGAKKSVTCKQISKAVFRNPMFLVESNGSDVGIEWFPIKEKMLDDNGDVVDNPKYKAMMTVMETYVPKSKDADNATRVFVKGSVSPQEYVGKDGNWKSFPSINGFQITSSNVPEEDSTDSEISGIIKRIYPETRGEEGEETGRYKIELCSFDYSGKVFPTTFIVEEDLVEGFADYYEVGSCAKLYFEIVSRQVGARKSETTGGFGKRKANIVSGFTVTEYSIFNGDDAYEAEDELGNPNKYFISSEELKKALEEREFMIEKKIAESKEKGSTTTSSPRGASATASSDKPNPFGEKKRNPFAK